MTTKARTLRVGIGLCAAGTAVVLLGWLFFPDSNLGGGLALLAAPLMLGGFATVVATGLAAVVDRAQGKNVPGTSLT